MSDDESLLKEWTEVSAPADEQKPPPNADPSTAGPDRKEEPTLGDKYFKDKTEIPATLYALPFIYAMKDVEWTTDVFTIGATLVVMEVLIVLAFTNFIKSTMLKNEDGKQKIWIPTKDYSAATEEEKKQDYIQLSIHDVENDKLWQLQKSVLLGAGMGLLLPKLTGMYHSVVYQAVTLPLTLVRSKLFKKHLLGVTYENPWGAVQPQEQTEIEQKNKAIHNLSPEDQAAVKLGGTDGIPEIHAQLEKNILNLIRVGGKINPPSKQQLLKIVDEAISGGNVNFQTKQGGYTLLMALCRQTCPYACDIIRKVLEASADAEAVDSDGWTCLHWCCFYDCAANGSSFRFRS
mmetsp:Transcript_19325/g.31772  ORF Transcript_19325/g.31772 Transcript_19325/m.31772 type:complete len:347 (-) Transcript_19325:132-1172(-)